MRKRIFFSVFLFLSVFAFADTIKVMSFNVGGLDHNHRAISNAKWLNNICFIIKQSGADIVLLQEFYTELPKETETTADIKAFQNMLGNNWQYFCSNKYISKNLSEFDKKKAEFWGKTSWVRTQNNIIFFNNRKVLAINDSSIINFASENLQYKFAKNHTQVVEFRLSGQESKNFVVVNVHTAHPRNLGNYRKDIETLEKLYKNLSRTYKILIGGDFNTSRKEPMQNDKTGGEVLLYKNKESKSPRFYNAVIDSESPLYCYPQGGLFTCRFEDHSGIYPTLDTDHFITYGMRIKNETRHALQNARSNKDFPYGQIKIASNSYTKISKFKKDVSDHLPIIIEIEL